MKRCTAAVTAILAAGVLAGADEDQPTSPTDFLRAHDAQVRAVVMANPDDSLNAAERQAVQALINDAFDFRELSRLSLGTAWDERTETERAEFIDVYRRIVEERNFDIFVRYHREGKVTYTGEEIGDDGRALVRAEVPVKNGKKEITYSLHRRQAEGPWRIFDIAVDGAGTVAANNRAWTRYLARHSYAQLLERLRQRLNQLDTAGG